MKFFLDENFPRSAAKVLAELGHEIFDIRGTDQEGCDDSVIFRLAQAEKAIFLTTDADFFHTVPHQFPDHYGVVVITLRNPNRQTILDRLHWFLNQFELGLIQGHVFRLRDNTYAVYPGFHRQHGKLPK